MKSFTQIFIRILPVCFKKVLAQGENVFWRMIAFTEQCETRSAKDETGTQKFTISVRIPDLNPMENTFHIVSRSCGKTLWIDRQLEKILLPFTQGLRLLWSWYLLMSWTELPFQWTKVLKKLLNKKDRGLNSGFVLTCC